VTTLRAQIAAAGLEQRIRITGELDAAGLAGQLAAADLFVLATRFEGYGMAVAQALAYGLPVVSTRTGAIAELVSPQTGLLVEPDDGAALRDALQRVLIDPGLHRSLASHARRVGASLPDWATASRRLSEVLVDAARAPRDAMLRP
jgi:glycosyltransferase involved in cell wall biosynthesis